MKKILTSISLSIFAAQACAMTIDQFEKILTQEEQDFYLVGLADGIVMGNAVNAAFGNPVDMCIPANMTIGGAVVMNSESEKFQAIATTVKFSKEAMRLETNKSNQVAVSVYFGLRRLFPCR